MIEWFNATSYLALCVAAAWAVMSHRFRDGVVMKVGLILVSLGFFATFLLALQGALAGHPHSMTDAFIHIGLLICLYSYLQRMQANGGRAKRRTDWVDTRKTNDENPSHT